VGFTLALAGLHGREPFLHSHMTAVLDGWRDRGIGRRLKIFQREDALARGIERIDWSFDPLQIKNAYINLVRLGAIVRRFIPNMYGAFSSPLQGGLPTDRLIAEWHLKSTRVKRALGGASDVGRVASSGKRSHGKGAKIARVRVTAKAITARTTQPDEALRLQAEVRQEFEYWLNLGYAATFVTITSDGMGGEYVLEPWKQT
jgi:predicted GNAT superfamily acetyltransferase